jgi:hypothetical protein
MMIWMIVAVVVVIVAPWLLHHPHGAAPHLPEAAQPTYDLIFGGGMAIAVGLVVVLLVTFFGAAVEVCYGYTCPGVDPEIWKKMQP